MECMSYIYDTHTLEQKKMQNENRTRYTDRSACNTKRQVFLHLSRTVYISMLAPSYQSNMYPHWFSDRLKVRP